MKLSVFTRTELEILKNECNFVGDEPLTFELLSKGKTLYEISRKLNVSERTASRHIQSVKAKIIRTMQKGVLK